MQLARVIGQLVATRKDAGFDGIKLLLIQPLSAAGEDIGRPLVAVDSLSAGVGQRVFFVRGKEASFPWYPIEVPADAGIVGIVDHVTLRLAPEDALAQGKPTRLASDDALAQGKPVRLASEDALAQGKPVRLASEDALAQGKTVRLTPEDTHAQRKVVEP